MSTTSENLYQTCSIITVCLLATPEVSLVNIPKFDTNNIEFYKGFVHSISLALQTVPPEVLNLIQELQ